MREPPPPGIVKVSQNSKSEENGHFELKCNLCHFLHLCARNEENLKTILIFRFFIIDIDKRKISAENLNKLSFFPDFCGRHMWVLAIWWIWGGCYWIKRLAHHLQGLPSGMGGAAPTGEFAPSSPSRKGLSLPGPWMVTPSCWASSSWSAWLPGLSGWSKSISGSPGGYSQTGCSLSAPLDWGRGRLTLSPRCTRTWVWN